MRPGPQFDRADPDLNLANGGATIVPLNEQGLRFHKQNMRRINNIVGYLNSMPGNSAGSRMNEEFSRRYPYSEYDPQRQRMHWATAPYRGYFGVHLLGGVTEVYHESDRSQPVGRIEHDQPMPPPKTVNLKLMGWVQSRESAKSLRRKD